MNRPVLTTIYNRVKVDLTPSGLRFQLKNIFAKAISGTAHMLYGYITYLAKVSMPDSQDTEMLEKWCHLFNVPRILAQKAKIKIIVNSTEPVQLTSGTKWQHESNKIYSLIKDSSIDGEQELVIECESQGSGGNRESGEILTVTATIAGLLSEAAVKKTVQTGAEDETEASLRTRLISRLRQPPQGGCPYDYVAWTKALPGVSRAWVLPRPDGELGTVHVTYVTDAPEDMIPDEADTLVKQEKILEICPATANIRVLPPVKKDLHLRIELTPDDEQTLEEVRKEIKYLLLKKASPRGFISENITNPESGVIYESDIHQAISASEREVSHRIISI